MTTREARRGALEISPGVDPRSPRARRDDTARPLGESVTARGAPTRWYVNLPAGYDANAGPRIPLRVDATFWGEPAGAPDRPESRHVRWELEPGPDNCDPAAIHSGVDNGPEAYPAARLTYARTCADARGRFENELIPAPSGGDTYAIRIYAGAEAEPREEITFETWRRVYYSVCWMGSAGRRFYADGEDLDSAFRTSFVELTPIATQEIPPRPCTTLAELKRIASSMPELDVSPYFKLMAVNELVQTETISLELPLEPYRDHEVELGRDRWGVRVRYSWGAHRRLHKAPVVKLGVEPEGRWLKRRGALEWRELEIRAGMDGHGMEIHLEDPELLRRYGEGGEARLSLTCFNLMCLGGATDPRGHYVALDTKTCSETEERGRARLMTILLHELGHLFGLVHRSSPHRYDSEHGGYGPHCSFNAELTPAAEAGQFAEPAKDAVYVPKAGPFCVMFHAETDRDHEATFCQTCLDLIRTRDLARLGAHYKPRRARVTAPESGARRAPQSGLRNREAAAHTPRWGGTPWR